MKAIFLGRITDGGMKISDKKALTFWLSYNDGKDIELTLRTVGPTRSTQSNKYYWGVVIPDVISGLIDAGYSAHECTKDRVHTMLKNMFLPGRLVNEKTGEILEGAPRSTADLEQEEFSAYLQEIFIWAGEFLGITIRSPEDY